jgi:hypothetical protein
LFATAFTDWAAAAPAAPRSRGSDAGLHDKLRYVE